MSASTTQPPSGQSDTDPGSFVTRHLDVTYSLGSGSFADGASDTVTLTGYRMSAAISKQGGVSQGGLDLRVYGMSLALMNKISLLGGVPLQVSAGNEVTLLAYNGTSNGYTPKAIAFKGTITNAWPDFAGSPDVAFCVTCFGAVAAAEQVIPASSFPGSADVATILSGLAKQMGLQFENNGVAVKLSNPYFPGSAYTQAERVANAAGINMTVDDGTLAIWPQDGVRAGTVPLISPVTGMIGYPVRNQVGVTVRCLYNPAIKMGATIQIQSSLTPAAGTWQVTSVDHNLESEMPGGQWFSTLTCLPPGFL